MSKLAKENLLAIAAQKAFRNAVKKIRIQSTNQFGEVEGSVFAKICEKDGYTFQWLSSFQIANYPGFVSKAKIVSPKGYELLVNF